MRACEVPGCTRPAAAKDRRRCCWAHSKRRKKKQPLETPVREPYESPLARLEAAALAYAEVDSEDDEAFRKARERLRSAGRRLATIPTPPGTHTRLLEATADFLSGVPVPPPVAVPARGDTRQGEEESSPGRARRRRRHA